MSTYNIRIYHHHFDNKTIYKSFYVLWVGLKCECVCVYRVLRCDMKFYEMG